MAEREGFPERLGQSCSSQRPRCIGPWGLPGAPLLTGLPPRSSRHWRRSALPPASPATTRRSSFRPSLPGAEVPMLIFTGWFFAGLRPAVPFESLSLLLATHKKNTHWVLFCFGGERGIPGATGAVAPPARGTKKPFTGWFFAGLRPAVPFESLSPLLATQKSTPRVLSGCRKSGLRHFFDRRKPPTQG